MDGQAIQTDKEVVSVVDDWAMHSSSKVTFEQLTVGGCWKGITCALLSGINSINMFVTSNLIELHILDNK